MQKSIALIGVGNCGSQVADLAERKYPELMDCVYINTSASDLAMVKGQVKFKIGDDNEEFDDVEGTGKNRLKMKMYLREEIDKILTDETFCSLISKKKYVFIIVSAAGGTGSGSGPALLKTLKTCFPDVNFILVVVLPVMTSTGGEFGNTEEFLKELYSKLDDDTTYMMYDNDQRADLPNTQRLVEVNEAIVEDIRVLSGVDCFPTPYDSIDAADFESIITTPGRLLVTRIKKGITEKILEDTDIDDIIIKAIKKSCHAETDRNKRVLRWGIITHFTEEVHKLYNSSLEKLRDFIGTPIEGFNHLAVNEQSESLNFLYLIASGLSPINDKVIKIQERAKELKEAKEAAEKAAKYQIDTNNMSYDITAQRQKEERVRKASETVRPRSIIDEFID